MNKFIKSFVIAVAVVAAAILAFQIVDFIHMIVQMTHFETEGTRTSLVFDRQGFEPWFPFISIVESWWAWITKIGSVAFLIILARNSKGTSQKDS